MEGYLNLQIKYNDRTPNFELRTPEVKVDGQVNATIAYNNDETHKKFG